MRGRRPETMQTVPVLDVPKAPSWLDRDAKSEWKRIAPILSTDRRVLSLADLATLANYCAAVGQVAAAGRIIATEGIIFKSESGPKKHPAVGIQQGAMMQARLLAGELGLTPTSRSRAALRDDPADDADNDLGLE
ncbi:phage terminase small subunit P27 family [Ancylobacter aquaticus]|nr:phage terminase small subunit P27 family [Ancylobacter aquaticus]